MPVFSVKSGSKWSNKPESFAEVVEATTIDLPCASTGPAKKTALQKAAMNTNIGLRCESISAPNPIKIVLLQNGTFDFSQNSIEANVRYWPQSGHALVHCTCPLLAAAYYWFGRCHNSVGYWGLLLVFADARLATSVTVAKSYHRPLSIKPRRLESRSRYSTERGAKRWPLNRISKFNHGGSLVPSEWLIVW